jgi:hypothetical protein
MNPTKLKGFLQGELKDWEAKRAILEQTPTTHHLSKEARDCACDLAYVRGRIEQLEWLVKLLSIAED